MNTPRSRSRIRTGTRSGTSVRSAHPSAGSPRDQLHHALLVFRHTATEALLREAKQVGCTVAHAEVIRFVAEHGSASMKDIAAYAHITPPSASALVDSLVAKRLAARSGAARDRRSIRVTLTPAGRRVLDAMHRRKHSVFDALLAKLSAADRAELIRILTILSS